MMKMIHKVQAETIKMKHTFLIPFHMAMPILAGSVYWLYYSGKGHSRAEWTILFLELIGMALPFVISLVCAENISLEAHNHFQVFLGSYRKKWMSFAVKWLVLSGMGALAIFGVAGLIGAANHFLQMENRLPANIYLMLVGILIAGSIPLYLEHLCLNLVIQKNAALCIGVVETIISALFLTGLGDGRWQFLPCTWSARGIAIFGEILKNMGLY